MRKRGDKCEKPTKFDSLPGVARATAAYKAMSEDKRIQLFNTLTERCRKHGAFRCEYCSAVST